MKKLIYALIAFTCAVPAFAQNQVSGNLTASASSCPASGATTPGTGTYVVLQLSPQNGGGVGISVNGSFTGTVNFYATAGNGDQWQPITGTNINSLATASSTTAAAVFQFDAGGMSAICVRASSLSGGTPGIAIWNGGEARNNSSSGGSLPSGLQFFGLSNSNGSTTYSTSPFVGADTTQQSGTDRCAAAKTVWGTTVASIQNFTIAQITPVNMLGEAANQNASQQITCSSNPFPVSSNYGGADAENGGVFWLPDAVLFATQGLQLGISTAQVDGTVAGNQLGQGSAIMANSSGWSDGTSSCAGGGAVCKTYNPFVFAYGATVGYSSTVTASAPQTSTIENVGFGMPNGGIVAGLGAISMCSGEENVHAAFSGIRIFNPYSTGMQVGCGTLLTQDAEVVDGLYLTKPATASVANNATLATISKWWADTSGRVLMEWNNSPTATPGCGMTVNISGVTTGGGGVSINGLHQIAGLVDASDNLLLCDKRVASISTSNFDGTAKQIIFIQNTSTTDSCTSSCGSGTTGFFGTGMDINGQDGRGMHNLTLTSNLTECNPSGGVCTGNAPYTEMAISGGGWHLEDVHLEEGTDGITVGLEQATTAITLIGVYPTSNLANAIHLSNNFGAVKNFTVIMACVNTLGVGSGNTMKDDFNGNTLTAANNPCITYSTGGTGNVGDVTVTGANDCAEMTNGWCQQGSTWSYYLSGSVIISLNSATAAATFGAQNMSGVHGSLTLAGGASTPGALVITGTGVTPGSMTLNVNPLGTHLQLGSSSAFTDGSGDLTAATINTSTRCAATGSAANPSVAACSAAPAGSFSCATNASAGTCVISTTAVTASSAIFVQPDSSLGTLLSVTCNTTADTALTAPRVSARSAGTSFTITLGTFTTNPLCFNYWVVN